MLTTQSTEPSLGTRLSLSFLSAAGLDPASRYIMAGYCMYSRTGKRMLKQTLVAEYVNLAEQRPMDMERRDMLEQACVIKISLFANVN